MSRALVVALVLLITGCGGSTSDDVQCRPDIVGPPSPDVAHLPVCGVSS